MNSVEVAAAGVPLARAKAAVVMLHGRGASAENMLSLVDLLAQPDVAYLAPQAPGSTWYPYSFLEPIARNEPALSQALATVDSMLAHLAAQGLAADRVMLLGFSQGGCLALEYAARNARRYGALAGLSAGLIGPPGTPRDYPGAFAGTPAFLGCSDVDPHIPLPRVHETRDVLARMGAAVTTRVYPGMPHTINADEIAYVRALLAGIGQV